MKPSSLRSMKGLLTVVTLFGGLALSAIADVPKSLLPAFGNDGQEFSLKSKDDNTVKGWLPKDWTDNSDWAAVTATYTKLSDSPDKNAGAVRLKVEKLGDGSLLQLTTYGGNQKYKMGTKYVVSGWIRSADRLGVKVGARMFKEPYEFYHEEELATSPDWKRFEFAFTPTKDIEAIIMFVVHDVGAVDLAGIAVEEKP
jgi:hypothetical protein